jgi:ADP-ribose pyrophosphatase YjhB (NUDIX family)
VGIAQTGLAFTANPYDVERYEGLLKLAAEITATINAQATLDPILADELDARWRRQVQAGFKGYVTPKVGVGAIVFNTRDEILLVHSSSRHDWCFPAGMADIGSTPAEVARKEVLEEAGLHVTPVQLMGVADSFRRGSNYNVHIYNLLFYCRLDGGEPGPQTAEILEAGFFGPGTLPQPLVGFAKCWVDNAFDWHFGIRRQPYFD